MTGVVVFGTGFIASAVARAFAGTGRSVTMVGLRNLPVPDDVGSISIGFARAQAVAEVLAESCDVVFAAGPSSPSAVQRDPRPSLDSLDLLSTVLDSLADKRNGTLLFVSSGGAIYGEPDHLPIPEAHPLRPCSVYGALKLKAEALVLLARQQGLAATSIRCGNAYGLGQDPGRRQGLVAVVLDRLAAGRAVEIWGDGLAERDYVHVDDIGTVIATLARRRGLPAAINVGSGTGTSVLKVVEIAAGLTGRTPEITHLPSRGHDVSRVVLDTRRLRGLMSFSPRSLEAGISAMWAAIGLSVA